MLNFDMGQGVAASHDRLAELLSNLAMVERL
jgi:hypothetical protein